MIQPKYSPKEALEKIKLSMKYDLSKTLNENVGEKTLEQLNEQSSSCPNSIPYDDVKEMAQTLGQNAFSLTAPFSRMRNTEEKAQEILDGIKQVAGKNTWDSVESQCVPAIGIFDRFFKKSSQSWFGTSGGKNVSNTLKDIVKDEWLIKRYPDAIRAVQKAKTIWDNSGTPTPTPTPLKPSDSDRQKNINDAYCSVKDGKITLVGSKHNGKTWDSWVKIFSVTAQEIETAKNSCRKVNRDDVVRSKYVQCSETLPIKMFCKNSTITRVQGCLGIKQDGAFGPLTSQALVAKGADGSLITQASIDKVCGGGAVEKEKDPASALSDDFGGEKSTSVAAPVGDTNL